MIEIMKKAAELGKLMKEDPIVKELLAAKDAYEHDEEINRLFTEYNVQQQALTHEYANDEVDSVLANQINHRIETLQAEITAHPLFIAYGKAEEEYMEFMKSVQDEISFQITGHRSCSGQCSSCTADCQAKETAHE